MLQARVLGLKELERKLKALPKNISGKNLVGKSLRKSANIIRDEAKVNAPYDDEDDDGVHIRDQIKVKRDPKPHEKGKSEIMYVKPFYTKKYPVAYWWYWEFGSVKTKETRFMTKSFEAKKEESVKVFKIDLGKQIEREAKKLSK